MENAKAFIAKVLLTWATIGAALTTLTATGFINVPDVLLLLFSENISNVVGTAANALLEAIGLVIVAFQAIRAIFVSKELDAGDSVVKALNEGKAKGFKYNPFKLSVG